MLKTASKKRLFWLFIIIVILLLVGGIVILFRSPKSNKSQVEKEPKSLETIIIQPTKKHSASVIFLHGLGNNAQNQHNICQPLSEKFPSVKFIIPQAPTISVSMNGGWPMPA